jgi:hypothetical protein
MIELTKDGMTGSADSGALQEQFEQTHTVRLPGLIRPDLMRIVSAHLEQSPWDVKEHGKIGREIVPADPEAMFALHFVVNGPGFLELIRQITGCPRIEGFMGRIYRMLPDPSHYDSWHSDIHQTEERLIGMSINLSPTAYDGGVFRLRDEQSGNILCELPNTGWGDAILFRLSPNLRHMVTAVEGGVPKTAFAGWFKSSACNFFSMMLEADHSKV